MIEFLKYAKIKDSYCVCYFGLSDEYLIQLNLLKNIIEKNYSKIKIFIGCRDEKYQIFDNKDYILRASELRMRRFDFGHIRELRYNGKTHPVEDLIKESEISDLSVCNTINNEFTTKCVIVSKGNYPTVSLTNDKIEKLKRIATSEGFNPLLDDSIHNAGLVMGVESVELFQAASQGIKTRLCPSGIGTNLYKSMFPKGEILSV
jgi:hypothetical protein